MREAGELDRAEDELFGDARGDELPEGFRSAGERRARLRAAKLALDAERAAKEKKVPREREERLRECGKRLEQDHELERRVIAEHEQWFQAGIEGHAA